MHHSEPTKHKQGEGEKEKFKPNLAGQGKFEPEVLGFCSQIQVLDPGGLEVKSLLWSEKVCKV